MRMTSATIFWRALVFLSAALLVNAQFENHRCHCICPVVPVVNSTISTSATRTVYVGNLEYHDCRCEELVLPQVAGHLRADLAGEFCARCDCKYQSRNTTVIQVAVVGVICVILMLVVYMFFLICLDPMLKRRVGANPYQHHKDEEDNIFAQKPAQSVEDRADASFATGVSAASYGDVSGASLSGFGLPLQHQTRATETTNLRPRSSTADGGVLERVGAEQDKWMRKLEEQRKKIFTEHSLLN